jgi:hypothetical protein
MDHLLERIQTLEQHVQSLHQQTTSVARRLRWWRRLAWSLAVLTVLGLPLTLDAGPAERKGRDGNEEPSRHHKRKDDDEKASKGKRFAIRPIDVPGALVTAASGINDRGQIIGGFDDNNGIHGFLLDRGVFFTIDVPDATAATALNGINNCGELVGFFSDVNAITHGFLLHLHTNTVTILGLR